MKRYLVIAHVGVFWKGPDIWIGFYRSLWRAKLAAHWYLIWKPYRMTTIKTVPWPYAIDEHECLFSQEAPREASSFNPS